MESSSVFFLLLAGALTALIPPTLAHDFYVGDSSGWTQTPSKSYIKWAEDNRFQVNDTLVFKYKKAEDSVLVVSKSDYDACNINTPLQRLQGDGEGDDSVSFKFDRSGAFYFISGAEGHCQKGQKMIVVVLALRDNDTPNPTPASSPPAVSPPSPSPNPVLSPSPSPKPVLISSPSPSPTPSSVSSPSPSPAQPTLSSPSPTPSSVLSPSPSPAKQTLSSPSPSPAAQPPKSVPSTPSVSSSSPASAPSQPTSVNNKKSSSSLLSVSAASFGLAALFLSAALF